MTDDPAQPQPRHRWARPSVRGLLLTLAAPGVGLGWWADRTHRQAEAVRWIEGHGGRVLFTHPFDEAGRNRGKASIPDPPWPRHWLGDDAFRRVATVIIPCPESPPDPAELGRHLASLSGLERLDLLGRGIDDRHLAPVARLRSLRELSLAGSSVGDSGLERLEGRQLRSPRTPGGGTSGFDTQGLLLSAPRPSLRAKFA